MPKSDCDERACDAATRWCPLLTSGESVDPRAVAAAGETRRDTRATPRGPRELRPAPSEGCADQNANCSVIHNLAVLHMRRDPFYRY